MTLLCAGRHAKPAEAAPSFRVCWTCHDRFSAALDEMRSLSGDLEAALSKSMSVGGEKVSGSPARMLELNEHAAAIRWRIHNDMATTVRLVIEERDWHQYPVAQIESMAVWLSFQVNWLCAHASAGERVAEAIGWPGLARTAIHPNPPKRVTIGPCVRDHCEGTLIAIVRPQDALLPSSIVCTVWVKLIEEDRQARIEDGELEHAWSADQWHALGRLVTRRTG